MIKSLFFDFDLTLVDSRKPAKATYDSLCKITGKIPSEEGFDSYIGQRLSKSLMEFSITKSKKEINKLRLIFIKTFLSNLAGMKVYGDSLLAYLKKQKISVYIISNNAHLVVSAICDLNKFHFNQIFADEEMKIGEEKHQIMSRLLKKLKLKRDEVFYVGDHINDIIQGHKAGLKVISVTTGSFNRKALLKYKPDFIVDNLNKIKEKIKC
jgi:phosphoglycolate phosphatase